jgi:hypothetical protein
MISNINFFITLPFYQDNLERIKHADIVSTSALFLWSFYPSSFIVLCADTVVSLSSHFIILTDPNQKSFYKILLFFPFLALSTIHIG